MNKHHEPARRINDQQVTLRSPAELADSLPYLLGFHPTDSIVMVALQGSRGRFGGRVRLGIPRSSREWQPVAKQLAECLVEGSERRGARPDLIVVFLCQDPADGETSQEAMERLRPLAQRLRTACGDLGVPVYEALCISDGRFWSYCCPDPRCCPPEGKTMSIPGTSVMAAAAAYAGIQVQGTLREMESRLVPWTTPRAAEQKTALDRAGAVVVPRILEGTGRKEVAEETLALAAALVKRIDRASRPLSPSEADAADDRLITHEEAATVILGLQDRETRDRAAEWMEGPEALAALRLWRALARRCVGPYTEHAAAPLTLAGWVAWSTGDEPGARVALGLALRIDPEYVFARLLHQACNEGLDPETLRDCLRKERAARESPETGGAAPESPGSRGAAARPQRRPAPRPPRRAAAPKPSRPAAPKPSRPAATKPSRPAARKPSRPAATRSADPSGNRSANADRAPGGNRSGRSRQRRQ